MLFVVNQLATCGAIAVQATTKKFFNWTTGAFDSTTFSATTHVKAIAPLVTSPAALASVQDVDVTPLIGQTGVILCCVTLDASGNPVQTIDVGIPPSNQNTGQGVFA